jgi:hypothetical protein
VLGPQTEKPERHLLLCGRHHPSEVPIPQAHRIVRVGHTEHALFNEIRDFPV